MGSSTDRPRYIAALREALAPVKHRMSADNQRRAETNPLRVLDSKAPEDQEIIDGLPKIADFLDEDSRSTSPRCLRRSMRAALHTSSIRGSCVGWITTHALRSSSLCPMEAGSGTQNALLGGGRYDGLSEMLGGPKAPGIGFAIGEDRLILTLQAQAQTETGKKLDAFIAPMGIEQNTLALALAQELRREGFSVEVGDGSFRLKKSFEAADKLARRMVILGADEAESGILTVKALMQGNRRRWRERSLPTRCEVEPIFHP